MDTAYTIKRSSKRKKLTITVERDRSVVVHAPESTPEDTIREVVESKRRWIYEKAKHAQKYEERPHPPGKELVNGESTLYLGREYQIELIPTDSTEIRFETAFPDPGFPGGQAKASSSQLVHRASERYDSSEGKKPRGYSRGGICQRENSGQSFPMGFLHCKG